MIPTRTIVHSATQVSGGRVTPEAWLVFDGDRISAVGRGDAWRRFGGDGVRVTDAAGRWLTPGFIDIHCHGGGGVAFDGDAHDIQTGLDVHHSHGSTRLVLSLVTASQEMLETQLSSVADAADSNQLVLGAHLEGPYLDREFRGAHDPALLRAPDAAGIDRLLSAGRGHLRQVTLAPELDGARRAIRTLVDAGITVAVGHSAAGYEEASEAFDAGASLLTHAFNGMRGIHHRAPGPVAAAMAAGGVTLEVINDGVHVHPEVVRMAFATAPGRIALITDAMAATGAPDGAYVLGSLAVTVADGVARLTDNGSIAGSTLTLDVALRRAVNEVGVSITDAVTAVTETPARAIGRGHDLGLLEAGYAADAVLLDRDLMVEEVYAAGRLLD